MKTLTHLRTALWAVVAVAALAATGLYVYANMRPTGPAQLGDGNYELIASSGEKFTRASLNGSPSLLFFGFTHCPDVCPTTMAEITSWYEALGSEADDLKAYFVSVDPERDTVDIVADYVAWTGKVTGLTGTPSEVEKMAKAWAVHFEKVPLEGGDYTMDHTASVFLLDDKGRFEGTIAYREDHNTALGKLRKLLN